MTEDRLRNLATVTSASPSLNAPSRPGFVAVARFCVPEADGANFSARSGAALQALAARPGYQGGEVGRSADDPSLWVVVTRWDGIGVYRRALSNFDVRVAAVPLLSLALDEPGAFEAVVALAPGAAVEQTSRSRRAADADVSGPGQASAPEVPTSLG